MPHAVRMHATGFDHPLTVEPFQPADPVGDQVLVQVEACGVCHRDLIDRAGRFPWLQLPLTPGHEAVGRVTGAGPEATWQVGDRVATLHRDHCGSCPRCLEGETSLCPQALGVFGLLIDGGYASHLIAPSKALYPVPDAMKATTAACLHCTAGTAYRGLRRADAVTSPRRVVVVGANGGVGSAAVRLAARLGHRVTAVVRREHQTGRLRELGAAEVIVSTGRFHKQLDHDADVVLDCVGASTIDASVRCLRPGGRVVVIGNVVDEPASLKLGRLIVFGVHILGSTGATAEDMAAVVDLWRRDPFDIPVHATLPLDHAEAAHQAVRAGDLSGRIVLIPGAHA